VVAEGGAGNILNNWQEVGAVHYFMFVFHFSNDFLVLRLLSIRINIK